MNSTTIKAAHMKHLAGAASVVLLAGLAALLLAANPLVVLLGKSAIAASVFTLATITTTYVARQYFAAGALRNEDFHWY